MSQNAKVATRTTATGTKVYIHTGCTCSKINGKLVKAATDCAAGETYAADNGFEFTYCKTSVVETPAPAPVETPAPAPVETPAPAPVEEPAGDFEVLLNNRDQFGAQRRTALVALVEAVGGKVNGFTGLKNRFRTGNNCFLVQVNAPAETEEMLSAFFDQVAEDLEQVIRDAKSHGKAEGWDSNTRQKHWKNTARKYIVAAGNKAAAELA